MLPEVKDSSAHFGDSALEIFGGAIAIRGIAGDQQAATIGQACFSPGMIKSTYGTGCFALLNTGTTPVKSNNRLLTTIAYQLGGKRTYALEGSIFAHAALESVCYQTSDLWAAMRADWPEAKGTKPVLRVDGGMTASDWTMQRLADLLDAPVDRPMIQETTALGAAYLAGLAAGIYPEPSKFADNWRLEHRFKPVMSAATRERKLAGWARAVKGLLASDEGEG
jgi:glycerol kinase